MTTSIPAIKAVGFRSERGPVLASVMLSTALVAIDSTIIATAIPSVVGDLGGFSQFPWLFSIYLLTQAVTVPLYGKFADVVGRKPVMFFGIAVFLLGSVLCGVAWSMPVLIAFRAVQGIGAGAVIPISVTIVGDLYTVEERARVQGYLASVWGAAAVIGPTLGGVFSQYVSWRWIFFVNVPIGALAVVMLARHLHEKVTHRDHRVDFAGAVLLIAGCSLLILGLLEGGVSWAWASVDSVVIFAAGSLLLIAFIAVEHQVAEPVLPLWVFTRKVLVGGNLAALLVGALAIGLTLYVPTYVQGVLGTGPLVAGFALAALSVGWPLTSALSGRLYMKIGFRDTAFVGATIVLIGTALCSMLTSTAAVWQVGFVCFVIGCGLGLTASPTTVAVQSVVGWGRRGVVTGTNMFCRSIGSAVGAAIFGAITNATLAHRLADAKNRIGGLPAKASDLTSLVLGSRGDAHKSPAASFARGALYAATHHVFVASIVVAVLMGAALFFMPRRTRELVFDD